MQLHLSLPQRVLLTNAAVLLVAAAGLIFTPATVSDPIALQELLVVVGGMVVLVLANLVLVRRAFAPLRQLADVMSRVEYFEPGLRIPEYADDEDMHRVTRSFNQMLDRLEDERSASFRRAVEAQEGERLRVAQELHDEVGQQLTGLKLILSRARSAPEPERGSALADAAEIVDDALNDVRAIARRLRPDVLGDLGLTNALAALASRSDSYGDVRVTHRLGRVGELDEERELAIYRIAQEALTNALRHSGAEHATVELDAAGDVLELVVRDDGRGLGDGPPGNGIKGMRERALLVGGVLRIGPAAGGGTEVRLSLPQ
jgi:two-component system, NarL family, sensor histidine kinase UhpB